VVPSGTGQFGVTATDPAGNSRTNTYEISTTGSAATYQYDPSGNLTQKVENGETWDYEWNAENELTRVTKGGVGVAAFKYDPIGRRVQKVIGTLATSYTYDREDILRETRSDGASVEYEHGRDADEPLARVNEAGALTLYHADGLGSIVRLTNQLGAVAEEYRYDAWGRLELGGGNPGYAFTGREWDAETQLYYYRARYYDPESGTFISEDPMGFFAGPNFYSYVLGNPVNLADPNGLQAGPGQCYVSGRGWIPYGCDDSGKKQLQARILRCTWNCRLVLNPPLFPLVGYTWGLMHLIDAQTFTWALAIYEVFGVWNLCTTVTCGIQCFYDPSTMPGN
jgi:RHS repeat-associated protein